VSVSNSSSWYRFVGEFLGKSLLDGHVVPVHLCLPLLKHLLGLPVSLSDVQFVDKDVYDSMCWLLTAQDVVHNHNHNRI